MPARPTMLLVHSPLLTSAVWDALRPHLRAAGWHVAVLDLRPLVEAPSLHAAVCAEAAARVSPGTPTVVVGHSRAGAYLPGIADAIGGERLGVVFLDARLPHPGPSWVESLPPERGTLSSGSAACPSPTILDRSAHGPDLGPLTLCDGPVRVLGPALS